MKKLIYTLILLTFWVNAFAQEVPVEKKLLVEDTCRSVAEGLKKPDEVYHLDLSGQGIKAFPMEILQFKNLQILHIGYNLEKDKGNHIQKLPTQIKELKKLEILNCSSNELQNLPKEIGQLKNLKSYIVLKIYYNIN